MLTPELRGRERAGAPTAALEDPRARGSAPGPLASEPGEGVQVGGVGTLPSAPLEALRTGALEEEGGGPCVLLPVSRVCHRHRPDS